jgi:hypothetical protein
LCVSPYEIHGAIGAGGTGKVRDTRFDRIAIKHLNTPTPPPCKRRPFASILCRNSISKPGYLVQSWMDGDSEKGIVPGKWFIGKVDWQGDLMAIAQTFISATNSQTRVSVDICIAKRYCLM